MNLSGIRTIGPAIVASSIAVLPVPLVGGVAVLLQQEMGFGEAQLGIAVALFFAGAALTAGPAGRLSDALGPRTVAWAGLGLIVASLLGVAFFADSWVWLAGMMALAGSGHALALLAVGVLLTRSVAVRRHGLAFGAAQAAAPLAALLAGLSVPTIALTLGWRAEFILAGGLGLIAAALMPSGEPRRPRSSSATDRDAPVRALILLAIGMAFASAGANSSVLFLVASAVDRGLSTANAGLVLAIASLVGLVVRVAAGWFSDRIGHESLLMMGGLIGVGAVGYVGLALSEHPALIVLFATFAFGGGWGWPGLMLLAVSRSNPGAPGAAMGIVTVGGLGGSVLGPIAYGAIAERVAFAASWMLIAVLATAAIVFILLSRRWILHSSPGSRP